MVRRAALAIVVVGVLAGCNDAASIDMRTGGSERDYPTFGPAPDVSPAAPEAVVTRCAVIDGKFEMEVVVTNTSSRVRFLQGAEYVIVTSDGDRDEGQLSGPGYDLGAGRQRRFWHEDSNSAAFDGATCEAGPADFRDPIHIRPGRPLPADAIELTGCTGETLQVTNPSDSPVGVFMAVERFDTDGLSLGRTTVDFRPKVIDDRSQGGSGRHEEGGTLAPGEQRIFDITPDGEFDEVASCAVTDASYEVDPETEETVIVG